MVMDYGIELNISMYKGVAAQGLQWIGKPFFEPVWNLSKQTDSLKWIWLFKYHFKERMD